MFWNLKWHSFRPELINSSDSEDGLRAGSEKCDDSKTANRDECRWSDGETSDT